MRRFIIWYRGKWFDFRNRHHRDMEGWCMCGARCDEHGWSDNHSPVDMYHYNRDRYVYRNFDL